MASGARLSRRAIELILVAVAVVGAGFALTSPIPQDPGYHLFADSRTLAGIPNAWNVLSNLPFLLVGLLGLVYVGRYRLTDGIRLRLLPPRAPQRIAGLRSTPDDHRICRPVRARNR